MAETVRDVLIRFRVEGPRSSGGGSPAVGGLAIGSSASASSVNRSGVGGDQDISKVLVELTDAIVSLKHVIQLQGALTIGKGALSLTGGAGQFGGGAAVGAGLGRLGAGAGALGARALAVGAAAAPFAIGAVAVVGAGFLAHSVAQKLSYEAIDSGEFAIPKALDPVRGLLGAAKFATDLPETISGVRERGREFLRGQGVLYGNLYRTTFGVDGNFDALPTLAEQASADPDIFYGYSARERAGSLGAQRGGLTAGRRRLGRLSQSFGSVQGLGTFGAAQAAGNRRLGQITQNISDIDIEGFRTRTDAARASQVTGAYEGAAAEELGQIPDLIKQWQSAAQVMVQLEQQKLQMVREQVSVLQGPAMAAFMMGPDFTKAGGAIINKAQAGQNLTRSDVFAMQNVFSSLVTPDISKMIQGNVFAQQRDDPLFRSIYGEELSRLDRGAAGLGVEPTLQAIEKFASDGFQKLIDGILIEFKTKMDALGGRAADLGEDLQNKPFLGNGDNGDAQKAKARE